MMTDIEHELLGNILDALDRLYDEDTTIIDLYALLYATAQALRKSEFLAQIEEPIAELCKIMRSESNKNEKLKAALLVTDPLRQFLADLIPD